MILKSNCAEFKMGDTHYLLSYNTVVAKIGLDLDTSVDPKWEYSPTTVKHVVAFIGRDAKTIRKQINQGIIKVENLN